MHRGAQCGERRVILPTVKPRESDRDCGGGECNQPGKAEIVTPPGDEES